MKKVFISFLVLGLSLASCKKKQNEEPEKIGGCTDTDSPYYKTGLDFDNGSCKYAYVTKVQVYNFPEKDNGSSWDWPDGKADLYFKIKPSSELNYDNYFNSIGNDIQNATHNALNEWDTDTNFKLTNADWYWELFDKDDTSGDDLIASGTFNPLSAINTSTGLCSINHNNGTQIKLQLVIE